MDRLTPGQRHRNMSHIRSKNTGIEIRMRKALRAAGFGYRIHYDLPGKPDIVLTRYHIVIFCDSEFFHGKDFDNLKVQLLKGNNGDFWITKIGRNIERDRENDRALKALGWKVLRFWGREIMKDTDGCIRAVREAVTEAKLEKYTED